jgi:AraC family transcriptional regulator
MSVSICSGAIAARPAGTKAAVSKAPDARVASMNRGVINPFGVFINPPAGMLGSVNAIYSGRSRRHVVENYSGPLSIKTMISGAAFWHTEAGAQRVRPSSFLVLNKGTTYTLEMNSQDPSHTFVLFFKDGFVEDVERGLRSSGENLLDNPFHAEGEASFVEAIYSGGESAVGTALDGVRRAWLAGCSAGLLEEGFRSIAVELIRLQNHAASLVAATASLRQSTKNELFRRLQRARVLMEDSYLEDLSLEDLAAEACLSPYHFHRTFREVYGVTPHQHLQRLRIQNAARLLRETDLPIAAVCAKSGFSSVPSFSTLFRSRFGAPPNHFRTLARKSKIR